MCSSDLTPVPNWSTSVAWVFEEWTVAEQWTATAAWWSGARLIPSVANLVKSSSWASDENKIAVLDNKWSYGKFVKSTQSNITLWESVTAWKPVYVKNSDWKSYLTDASDSWKIWFNWFTEASWSLDDVISLNKIGRANVWTPVTQWSRMPSSPWKKKKIDKLNERKQSENEREKNR